MIFFKKTVIITLGLVISWASISPLANYFAEFQLYQTQILAIALACRYLYEEKELVVGLIFTIGRFIVIFVTVFVVFYVKEEMESSTVLLLVVNTIMISLTGVWLLCLVKGLEKSTQSVIDEYNKRGRVDLLSEDDD
jgi:hypothetical protein